MAQEHLRYVDKLWINEHDSADIYVFVYVIDVCVYVCVYVCI
jgi:hypothetical protein